MDLEVCSGGTGVRVVVVCGALDWCAAHRFQRVVRTELDEYPLLLVVDLVAATSVDAVGVAALIRMARDARVRQVDFCLAGGERVRELLGAAQDQFECG